MSALLASRVSASVLLLASCASSFAADWPHYRGPSGNGVSAESLNLPAPGGFKRVWEAKVGTGTSSSVVKGGRLFTMGHEGENDTVWCLDAATGAVKWKFAHPVSLDPNLFEGGPRSTPTLAGDSVYTLSHEGHVHCFDAATGAVRWSRHLVKDFAGRKPEWGFSGAPLVDGENLIVDCGGEGSSTVALNRKSGELVWKAGSDAAGYAAPMIFELEGARTLVLFKAEALVGCDPFSGAERWRTPWKTSYDINAATPLLVAQDRILITSGYGAGATLVAVEGGKAREVWRNKLLRAHINSPVLWQGVVFGVDGNTGGGNLICMDPLTGAKLWEERSVKGGALIVASGKLVAVSEKGDLVIAEASREGFKQLSRQNVLSQRTWAQPVLSEGRIYVRDNQGNLVCLAP